ncbi:MAG: hypothetical protein A2Y40_01575 [Candidatus Margulisbacteria bacterium GWF2_35_9]|nr:MAG: hypothetical protein A2Y40_01575 [Candidatus Margulisbacteria bacterium GWF2_35_9]
MKNTNVVLSLSCLSFMFMLTLNALANILPINGYNTGQLSGMYPNLFVPAGVTFSIWGLIYIALLLFLYGLFKYKNKDDKYFFKLTSLFIASNLLNGSWILAWHYKIIVLSLIIMIALLLTLIKMYLTVKDARILNTSNSTRLIKFASSLYLGWISLATVANTSALLVFYQWSRFGLSEVFWTIVMILVVLVLTSAMLLRERDLVFSWVVLWAYYGIILKRLSVSPIYKEIILTTQISALVIILLGVFTIIKLVRKP